MPVDARQGAQDACAVERGRSPAAGHDARGPGQAASRPFGKDGIVTAGNASGIVDGARRAGAGVARDEARRRGLTPLGRLVVVGQSAGVPPEIMGIGPAPATRKALERAGLTLGDIDLIEVNEAFAGQYLAVEKELGLDRDKTNVNGGAIALGHPLGRAGTRLLLTLLLRAAPPARAATASPPPASAAGRASR